MTKIEHILKMSRTNHDCHNCHICHHLEHGCLAVWKIMATFATRKLNNNNNEQ